MTREGTDDVIAIGNLAAADHQRLRAARWADDLVGLLDLIDGTRDPALIEATILLLAEEAGADWGLVRQRAELIIDRRGTEAPPWRAADAPPELPALDEALLAEWEGFYGTDDD